MTSFSQTAIKWQVYIRPGSETAEAVPRTLYLVSEEALIIAPTAAVTVEGQKVAIVSTD